MHEVGLHAQFGGKFAAGDSRPNLFFRSSEYLHVRSIFHDAHGYMKNANNLASGRVHPMTRKNTSKLTFYLVNFQDCFSGVSFNFPKQNSFDFFPPQHFNLFGFPHRTLLRQVSVYSHWLHWLTRTQFRRVKAIVMFNRISNENRIKQT